MVDEIEELKIIEAIDRDNANLSRTVIRLAASVIVVGLLLGAFLAIASCADIQPKCLFADTNNRCGTVGKTFL